MKVLTKKGAARERPLWTDYFPSIDGIVFVVDVAAIHRMDEAREVLKQLLEAEILQNVPILILANKIDLPTALGPAEINKSLDLYKYQNRPSLKLCMASLIMSVGIKEGFQWMGNELQKRPRRD